MKSTPWLVLTLGGYFGTFLLLVAWYGWLSPSLHLPAAFVLILLCTPLLFPLRGLLHGRPYTVGWSLFLALFYFTHGAVEAYSTPEDRLYGLLEVLFSFLWFCGGILYVRSHARQRRHDVESAGST
ncbi:MAG: DUF2069 domain-containing protein [Gammaproteobacteria bacterium]|jgi:uncharacterized membrane protein|nr:DUF2069 domain-containing protein [Gammaproteobacteria bacterium]